MDFMGVGVDEQLLHVGLFELDNLFRGKESRETILEVMVTAFDFPFGVGCELHPMRIKQNSFPPSSTRFIRGAVSDLN